jgi:uncharacterized Zn-binding protein involved in type VI secretion
MGPAAQVTGLTLTGDVITGPGVPTVLTSSMIQSVVGDLVSGSACVGAITMGSTTVLVSGRPAATVTSQVTGVNPETGVPVTTAVAPPGAPTVIIGS